MGKRELSSEIKLYIFLRMAAWWKKREKGSFVACFFPLQFAGIWPTRAKRKGSKVFIRVTYLNDRKRQKNAIAANKYLGIQIPI
jgi:hypothetical protein